MNLQAMLELQLRSKFNTQREMNDRVDDDDSDDNSHNLPAPRAELLAAAEDVLALLNDDAAFADSGLSLSAAQAGSAHGIVRAVRNAYNDDADRRRTLLPSRQAGDQLLRLGLVSAGGAPWREYGLGDNAAAADRSRRELARRHGMAFEPIPLFLHDFGGSIVRMGAAVAAVLLTQLRRGEIDGVFFACKGTLAGALALRAFARSGGSAVGVGFGTDLSQGFYGMTSEEAGSLRVIAVNSLQDAAVGEAGHEALAAFAAGQPHVRAESVDCDSFLDQLCVVGGESRFNPCHHWYPTMFARASAAPLKTHVLGTIASFFGCEGHGQAESEEEEEEEKEEATAAVAEEMTAVQRLRQRTGTAAAAAAGGGGLAASLAAFDSSQLKACHTEVKTLSDFVAGSEMFVMD